ncbi:Hypothetical predicted protein [Olea europaea subsp. europaea]|uniref:LisH domain-containing protein n=2 Tax=Olea europaea subsp. europaea TaxID=158383 RepID=A0A8S0SMZ6_OLEEU|nr:Hypothetical predicted protein [Olea europaea subsp. europaea]
MRKQTKSRKAENIGKGKVTPVQIAFIVDRYLSDNNYPHTRSAFRSEASNLISKSPVREAPKSLLSLGAILDEYIRLKEKKVMLDQEWCRLEQEKSRVQNLLRGMQDVMNAYNFNGDDVTLPPQLLPTVISNTIPKSGAEGHLPKYNTPAIMSKQDLTNFSIPITSHSNTKRKGSEDVKDAVVTAKKSRLPKDSSIVMQAVNSEKSHEDSAVQSYVHDNAPSESSVQGSNVVKCLSTQPIPSPLANSSGPETPPRALSPHSDSPLEICSSATPSDITEQITSSITQTIRVSPAKQIAYYSIEKTRCISTSSPFKTDMKMLNRKEHIKGRLDFDDSDIQTVSEISSPDGTSTSEFGWEEGIPDFDMTNLDNFGFDFNLSELLVEFDLQ